MPASANYPTAWVMFSVHLACSWIHYCWCPNNIPVLSFWFISTASRLVDDSQRHH